MAKNKRKHIYLWICVAALSINAIYCWISIGKLDSKNLKNKFETVESKCDAIQSNLNKIKSNLITVVDSQTKKDSTLSQTFTKFNNELSSLKEDFDNLTTQVTANNSGFEFTHNKLLILGVSLLILLILFPYVLFAFLFCLVKKLSKSQNQKERNNKYIDKIRRKLKEFINDVLNSDVNKTVSDQSSWVNTENNNQSEITKKGGAYDMTDKNKREEQDMTDKNKREEQDTTDKNKREDQGKQKEESTEKYLAGISTEGDGFNLIVDSCSADCFFKIFNIEDNNAEFALCVEVKKARDSNIFTYSNIFSLN
jgi:hypothetical protein